MTGSEGEEAGSGRTWRGRSASERRSRRYDLLIEAGIELFGTRGYAASPVKAICEQAGLTERYFYESFADREDLLIRVFDHLVEESQARITTAIEAARNGLFGRLSAGLEAFFTTITTDPRQARIQLVETVGVNERVETHRRQAVRSYAALLIDQVRPVLKAGSDSREAELEATAIGLVGALNEQMIELVRGDLSLAPDELLDLQRRMLTAVFAPLLEPGADQAPEPADQP